MSYLSVHPTGNQDRHGENQKETERFLVESKQRSELGRMAQLVEPTGTFSRRMSYELLKCPPHW